MKKTLIIGSGIVGTYLAKQLGDRAEVWEKNKKLKRKTCGGLISKTGLNSLNLPHQETVLNKVKSAKIKAGEEQFTVERKKPQALVLDMKKLKKKLREQAKEKGAKIKKGKTWKSSQEKNQEKDRTLVGTDGAISQVARKKSKLNPTYSTYQIVTETQVNPDQVELYLGEYAPKFFAWKIPLNKKQAKLGIATLGKNPKKAFKQFTDKEKIEIDEEEIKREESAPIPLFDPDKKIIGKNWALLGDAAGQVKATTGGGVVLGCKSAEYLAEAIKKQKLELYKQKYEENIKPGLKTHLKLRKYLNNSNKERLIKKIKKHKVDKLIEKHGDMDHPGKLKKEVMKRPQLWPLVIDYLTNGKLTKK